MTGTAAAATVRGANGMVATSQPLATAAALAVLEQGGNAIDAAVTAAAVLSVTEPMMTGIGGDLFAMIWLAREQRVTALNASGRSGSLMSIATLARDGLTEVPRRGAKSVTVPGALAGWQELLQRHGTMDLGQALAPAITIAERGFEPGPRTAAFWRDGDRVLRGNGEASATFLVNGSHTPLPGERVSNPHIASTYRRIAREGIATFYGGTLGEAIARHVQQLGGYLTTADLAEHRNEWVEPLAADYRGARVHQAPPNAPGIAVLEVLRILEGFDVRTFGHNTATCLHHLVEATRLAGADLAQFIGEPEAMITSPTRLLTDAFIAPRRSAIAPGSALPAAPPGSLLTGSDTTCLAVGDRDGNLISLINSISESFGSGVVVPGTGFALQNRGCGFSTTPGLANAVAPRKRPLHTLIPALVTRPDSAGIQQPWLGLGVIGGTMQPQGQVQILVNLLDFDMDLHAAIAAPRFRHLAGNRVALEAGIPSETAAALATLGHDVVAPGAEFFGGAQIIARQDGAWAGASEPRLEGRAAGY